MTNPLQPIAEQAPPLYDRIADIVWWRGVESDPDDDFVRSLPDLQFRRNKQQSDKLIFFKKVPHAIRRRIYAFIFEYPANGKQVNLSKDFTTKDVFPSEFFIVPWDLLYQVEGALTSCIQMRDELSTYFWNTYHFHVTFSPYSIGPVFSGLSIRLLNGYAHRVNHLTVEVDLTKLAFSAARDAKLLKQGNKRLQKVLVNLVTALGRRRHKGNFMASLTLLARRYQGFRPAPADAPEEKEIPYCPENALYIFDCFCELRPLVLQCRMSGFSIWYTRQLLRGILIPPFLTKPRHAPIIPAWPHYTPSPPEVAFLSNISTSATASSTPNSTPISIAGSTNGSIDIPEFNKTVPSFRYSQASSSAGSLIPTNSQNTGFYKVQEEQSEESQDHGFGYVCNTSSASSHNPSNAPDSQLAGSNSQRTGSNAELTDSNAQWTYSNTPKGSYPPVSDGSPSSMTTPRPGVFTMDDAGIPTPNSDSFSFTFTPSSTSTDHITIRSFGTPQAITAPETGIPVPSHATARFFRSRYGYTIKEIETPTAGVNSSPALGLGISMGFYEPPGFADEVDAEITRHHGETPPPRSNSLPSVAKSPSTIDELNKMNEMDPAFTRAIEGLRMASDDKDKNDDEGEVGEGDEKSETGESSKKGKKKEKSKKKGRKHWF